MDVSLLKDYAYLISAALAIGAVVYSWLTLRSKANSENLSALSSRVNDIEAGLAERLTKIEVTVDHVSNVGNEIKAVHQRMDEVAKVTSNIDGQMSQISRSLNLIHNHLLDQAGK